MKNLIRVGALLLCVLFFTLPLVKCSQDSSYTASGWEITTGTGKLFDEDDKGYPLAILLIIIPAVLLIATFLNKSFSVLRNISIAGLLVKIVFLIYASILLSSGEMKGDFELTGFNWLVLGIYIGLCAITIYCLKSESSTSNVADDNKRCRTCGKTFSVSYTVCPHCGSSLYEEMSPSITPSSSTIIDDNNKRCRTCGKTFSESYTGCPHCGSSLYEETNPSVTSSTIVGEIWVCEKCGDRNSINSSSCKGCGEYK